MRRLAIPCLLGSLCSGCLMTLSAGQALQGEVHGLRDELRATQHDVQMQAAQQAEQRQQTLRKIQELSEALAEYNQGARSSSAEFGAQMAHMIADVQQLRGTVETNEHRLGETAQSLAARLDTLSQKAPRGAESTAEPALPADKKEALALALRLRKEGKLADSRAAYRAILKQHGKVLGIADEAYYRLGEGYLAEHQYEDALREFVRIVEKFPQAARIDAAYYKIGLCSLQLGRLEDAETFFNEIVQNRRRSAFVRAARARLEELARRGSKKAAPAERAAPAAGN